MTEARFRLIVVALLGLLVAERWSSHLLPAAQAADTAVVATAPPTCTIVRVTAGDTASLLGRTNQSLVDLHTAGLRSFTFMNLPGGWDVLACGW